MQIAILMIVIAFSCEIMDASLGMGYGILLSPLLLIMGYDPITIIPATLLSHATGSIMASIFHHMYKNADFSINNPVPSGSKMGLINKLRLRISRDLKIAGLFTCLGVFIVVLASVIVLNLPGLLVKLYISIMVITIGAMLLLIKKKYVFSRWKIILLGMLAAFNKGMSGGGFGPLTTGGQIVAGCEGKNSIAVTNISSIPICLAGFFTFLIAGKIGDWGLLVSLCTGAFLAAPIGAYITKRIPGEKIKTVIGVMLLILGCWTLYVVL